MSRCGNSRCGCAGRFSIRTPPPPTEPQSPAVIPAHLTDDLLALGLIEITATGEYTLTHLGRTLLSRA